MDCRQRSGQSLSPGSVPSSAYSSSKSVMALSSVDIGPVTKLGPVSGDVLSRVGRTTNTNPLRIAKGSVNEISSTAPRNGARLPDGRFGVEPVTIDFMSATSPVGAPERHCWCRRTRVNAVANQLNDCIITTSGVDDSTAPPSCICSTSSASSRYVFGSAEPRFGVGAKASVLPVVTRGSGTSAPDLSAQQPHVSCTTAAPLMAGSKVDWPAGGEDDDAW